MSMLTLSDGNGLYYKDWGSGIPVVFSHGWPLTADAWESQMVFLAAHGFRCIAHDRRGHGRSQQTWTGNDMDTCADDLAELMAALDLADAIVVGHSMGGGEVARLIGRHGTGRIAKVVLMGSVTPLLARTASNPNGVPLALFDGMRTALDADRASFYRTFARRFYGANPLFSQVPRARLDAFWMQAMSGGLHNHLACIKAFSETDFSADLAKIDVPTLIIHGDHDLIVPHASTALATAASVANATLHLISGGTHGLAETHKDELSQLLLHFLAH